MKRPPYFSSILFSLNAISGVRVMGRRDEMIYLITARPGDFSSGESGNWISGNLGTSLRLEQRRKSQIYARYSRYSEGRIVNDSLSVLNHLLQLTQDSRCFSSRTLS